ncbi:uncharacterized protein F5147DRAFT_779760 [Suillus discolor]|uniref:Uncharacterized protein n=1 Tax=Suillus discolor TaxID=1912936 RepID=A0A9P7EUP0_9AGAM|nr:uncharacterized protein F5147DRAFT_779760 [Suillus discolor]KAG2092136.1 hypothetical protein F5147DRAFT_779760 [Suillus discolor]
MNQPNFTFTCNCGRGFQQESGFTRHQKSCVKGKKCLFSALNKAKDLLGSVKRARTCLGNQGGSSHHISPTTRSTSVVLDLVARDDASSRMDTISIPATAALTEEVTASASLITDSQEDLYLPLAQCRTRRNNCPNQPYQSIFKLSSSSPPHTQPSEALLPFRTPRNIFGLLHKFFSPKPPSHDPEEVVTLEDVSAIPCSRRERPMDDALDEASPYYPYPNKSSLELGDWYWNRRGTEVAAELQLT